MLRRLPIVACALSGLCTYACAGADTQLTTQFAPGFVPAPHTVSVVGVYENGHISTDGWDELAPRVVAAFRASRCDVGYSALVTLEDARADAIDEYARGDTSTADFVSVVGPAAQGDLVLLLTVGGRLPERERVAAKTRPVDPDSLPSALGGHTSGMMGGMPGAGSLAMGPGTEHYRDIGPLDSSTLDLSAFFYSVREGRLVATVAMRYAGTSFDEASAKFSRRLAAALPGSTCAGWAWQSPVAPAAAAP